MAAALQADFSQLRGLQGKIDRLLGLMGNELRAGIGAILKSSARRRISQTKRGPDGLPWADWSQGYAARRPQGKSLLEDSGALRDSLQFETTPTTVTVFAPVEWAASHQFGDERVVQISQHPRLITQAFGKPLQGPTYQTVKAHSQQRNIPARPFLGLGNEDVAEIERLVDNLTGEALA